MTTFTMPQIDKWISSNQRLHWAQRSRLTRSWRHAGKVYAQFFNLPKLEAAQIDVWIHKTTRRKYDPANLHVTIKAIVDGFVDYGLLPDDDFEHLTGPFIHPGERRDQPGLTITITPRSPGEPPQPL